MTDSVDSIHSCSYQCQRPACIKAQRDGLAKQNERYWTALGVINKHAKQGVEDPRFAKDQCALIVEEIQKLFY